MTMTIEHFRSATSATAATTSAATTPPIVAGLGEHANNESDDEDGDMVPTTPTRAASATTTVIPTVSAARAWYAALEARAIAAASVPSATATGPLATPTTPWPWTGPSEPWHGRHRSPSQYEIGFRAGYTVRRENRPSGADPRVVRALFELVNAYLAEYPDDDELVAGRDLLHSL